MSVDDRMWRFMQKRLGYSDDEMQQFRENPRNEDVVSKAAVLMDKVIVNRCKTHIQSRSATDSIKSPSPIEFPSHGSSHLGDGESDTAFSNAFRLSARPDALA